MPLLAGKVYVLNKRVKNAGKEGEEVKKTVDGEVILELTGEVCSNEEEALRKKFLYEERVWACRVTGQAGLTIKEALKSEQGATKVVKTAVKRCHEAALLAQVHHSRDSLENIIHKAWTVLHEEFCINEPVVIKLTSPKQLKLNGIVIKIDRSKHDDNCIPEESVNNITNDVSNNDKDNNKKKIPIKKSYYYSVKLLDMDKLVNDIPADTIERTLRPPSKDQIRMFIRSHAVRHSNKHIHPWVVDEDIVKKYKLQNLEPDFVNDKIKLKEMSRNAEIQVYNKLMEETQKKSEGYTVDLTASDVEDDIKHKNSVDNSASKKKLKQMTLLDMHSANAAIPKTQAKIKSPFTSPSRQLPPFAQQLYRMIKDDRNDPLIGNTLLKCCQYSDLQISKFPEIIRELIKEKKEKLELKKKLRNMSQEERDSYMAEKKAEMRQALREKKKDETKLDDVDITHEVPLLEGTPLVVSSEMNHDQWARIVSLSEFVRSFKGLLGPAGTNENGNLVVEDFCQAIISCDDKDREILANIICLFLKPLLQDEKLRGRKEMGVSLGEVPVTVYTAGELLRLTLPMCDQVDEDNIEEKDPEVPEEIENAAQNNANLVSSSATRNTGIMHSHYNLFVVPICDKLSRFEIYDLSIEEKITILELLQSRILELNIISTFIDECQREATEAYKKRQIDLKDLNDKLRLVRHSMSEMVKLKNFNAVEEKVEDKSIVEDDQIPLSARRRLSIEMKNKEAEEKEKRLELERQYQKLEKEESHYKMMIELAHQTYHTAINDAKQLMRVQPIGSDRRSRRYWQFKTTTEGVVYIEAEVGDLNKEESVTTSWTVLSSAEEVRLLMDCLDEKGPRECALKKELYGVLAKCAERKDKMTKTAEKEENKEENKESFLIRGFKDELRETELNIRQGSLGGVEDYPKWDERLISAIDLSQLKESFASVFLGVHERFWNPPLKSVSGRNDYITAIEDALTQSRLNVLQSFLDVCICWSKSASDDKCRVCHKSHQENRMLLCDACNRAYHTFCLRPPMKNIPEGEWLCPRCKPVDRASDTEHIPEKPKPIKTKKITKKVAEPEAEVVSEDDEVCCVCQTSEEGLGKCITCGNMYHAQCHEPPLRNMRRTNWHCSNCRVEDSIKVKSGKNKRSRVDSSLSESDLEVEEAPKNKKTKKIILNGTTKKISNGLEFAEQDEEVGKVKINKKSLRNGSKAAIKDIESDFEDEPLAMKVTKHRTVNGNGNKRKQEESNDESVAESDQSLNQSFITSVRNNRKRSSNIERNPSIKRRKTVRDSKEENISKSVKSILKQLTVHKSSWPFREPVNGDEVPDYYTLIEKPVDLSTMTQRLKSGVYDGVKGVKMFVDDIAQMFTNADFYNETGSEVMKLASELEQYFIGIFTKCDLGVEYSRSDS